jgi:hypothetical protein
VRAASKVVIGYGCGKVRRWPRARSTIQARKPVDTQNQAAHHAVA